MNRAVDIRIRFPQASASFLARNPQLSTTAKTKTSPVKSKTTTTEQHDPHDVTGGQVADAWDAQFFAGIEIPVAEYRFHKTRRWRFDYAWPACKVALEIEGGVWTGGRHTRGAGFIKDMEKYNAAAVAGWTVIRCTPDGLMSAMTLAMLREVLPRAPTNSKPRTRAFARPCNHSLRPSPRALSTETSRRPSWTYGVRIAQPLRCCTRTAGPRHEPSRAPNRR